jgi:choloylglycine hydrolase
VTVTPRNYNFKLKNGKEIFCHLAMMGIATVSGGYPLYYDAVNEKGLCMAGLNFPDNARYNEFDENKNNIAPFELIPYILSRCESVCDALSELENINLWDISFDEEFKNTPLHWLLCDSTRAITVEPTTAGLKIYENPVGVLTNNPPFDYHLYNLANYMNVTARYPTNRFCDGLKIKPYSLGMGSIGLPGDTSSASRFVRAAFIKQNSVCDNAVSQAFHILKAVEQPRGVTYTEDGECEYTIYTSVCDTNRLVYYYTTYDGGVCGVFMQNEDLDAKAVVSYPLCDGGIFYHN